MATMKLNVKTVRMLIDLEKRYGLLSRDMIHQEDLFAMQDELMQEIITTLNTTRDEKLLDYVLKKTPYLISTKEAAV